MSKELEVNVSRRQFVVLASAAAAACCTGCQQDGGGAALLVPHDADAGPASAVPADRVDDRFRNQGFFLVRRGDRVVALSSICTHQNCTINAMPDRSFTCKCHGSRFDPTGHVVTGPATRDLPVFATSTDAAGRLIVHVGTPG